MAGGSEAAGRRPSPVRRIVYFRAREIAIAVFSCGDEHPAVWQQRRRVSIASGVEATGVAESKRGSRARLYERQPHTEKKRSAQSANDGAQISNFFRSKHLSRTND